MIGEELVRVERGGRVRHLPWSVLTQAEKQEYNRKIMLRVTGGDSPAALQELAESEGWDG